MHREAVSPKYPVPVFDPVVKTEYDDRRGYDKCDTGNRQGLPQSEMRQVLRCCEVRCPTPDAVEPRRPRSPERQGPPRRRPKYDYFHDVDYLDYIDSG